jgi:hypothetical protein
MDKKRTIKEKDTTKILKLPEHPLYFVLISKCDNNEAISMNRTKIYPTNHFMLANYSFSKCWKGQ